jgi:CBS domain-containing protein
MADLPNESAASDEPALTPSPAAGVTHSTANVTTSATSNAKAETSDPYLTLITTPVRALIRRSPITVPPASTVQEVATVMRDAQVSSALIVDGGRLVGIVTDRDLRNRVVAAGLDGGVPVTDIATVQPLTVDVNAASFDVLLLMARHNLHHVPVMDGSRVVGMVTATDVTRHRNASAVFLASEIYRQDALEGLRHISTRIRELQGDLAAADATAYATGQVVTAITDALTCRLLQLAETRLGPPPVPYAWVAAGSQARSEQTARSDQDNCMILDDAYDPSTHGDYFRQLSDEVCRGLDACGYVLCPGEMMAMTDTWRQPQSRWQQYFDGWIDRPDPQALMLTCVFFDLRCIYGQASLLDDLRVATLRKTRKSGIFLAHLAHNAVQRRPPLSLFGRISTARTGPHRGAVDLKLQGIACVVDLARIYALGAGQSAVNTQQRLRAAPAGKEVSEQGARDLRDAFEHLSATRIRHQAGQISAGQVADSWLPLDELSNFERTQLKDAFKVVAELQEALSQRHQLARF